MVRQGLDLRLAELPAPSDRIDATNWQSVLGNGKRVADWTA